MSQRALPNPWVGRTYIPDNQRMEVPPAFFLQRLHDFDAALAVVPSRQTPFAYVIARRKRYSAGVVFTDINWMRPDTRMCYGYGLVPVCLMYKTGPTWDVDAIIRSLKARDLWAHGGAEKVADMLEAQEEAERQATRKKIRDEIWERSGDGWRTYQARTGQRMTLAPETRTGRRIPNSPPTSESTAGSGALFSNR